VLNPTHFGFAEMMASRYAAQTPVMPFRSFNDASVRVAIGSDGPMNPFLNIMLATIHPARPPEAVTRDAAIRAYTSGSAFAEFAERDKGTLARGKLADLAVLSQDIFSVAPPDLPKVRSVLTIVGGAIVHEPQPLR
jgi:predicted amidohydrolase YtcJ